MKEGLLVGKNPEDAYVHRIEMYLKETVLTGREPLEI